MHASIVREHVREPNRPSFHPPSYTDKTLPLLTTTFCHVMFRLKFPSHLVTVQFSVAPDAAEPSADLGRRALGVAETGATEN